MHPGLLAPILLALLLICSTGPGLLIVGRLRWSPMEKLAGAFAASFVVIYLTSLLLFCLNAGATAYWAASGLFVVMGILGWPTARLILRYRHTRRVLLAFFVVVGWEFLHLAMVRCYGGGNWAVDWREHYERTQYFLHQVPDTFLFGGLYRLPARPPMVNVMAAFFCRQVGMSFESFSLAMLFFNAWAFVPCSLFLGFVARRGSRSRRGAGGAVHAQSEHFAEHDADRDQAGHRRLGDPGRLSLSAPSRYRIGY